MLETALCLPAVVTAPPPETFTTVDVDVSCPNDHDGGVWIDGGLGGIGVGVQS